MPVMRERRVEFTLDKLIHDKITAKNISRSDINILAKKLISDYFDESKIDSFQKESLEILIKQEKLLRDQNTNELHEIKKRNLEADTKIKEYHAAHLGVIGPNPSMQAKKAMGYHVGKSADKNAIHCPDCTWHTNSADSIQYQIDRITDHIKLAHNRFFTDKEAQTISEMLR